MPGEPGEADDLATRRGEVQGAGGCCDPEHPFGGRRRRTQGRARSTPCPIAATMLSRVQSGVGRSSTMLPSRMTTILSLAARTSGILCEIKIAALPAATKRRMWAMSAAAAPASSDDVGSSRMTRAAFSVVSVKARAISTIWRRPIGKSPTTSLSFRSWPGKIRSKASCIRAPARRRHPKPFSAGWAMRAFSATDRFGQSESSWKTQRTPALCAARTS